MGDNGACSMGRPPAEQHKGQHLDPHDCRVGPPLMVITLFQSLMWGEPAWSRREPRGEDPRGTGEERGTLPNSSGSPHLAVEPGLTLAPLILIALKLKTLAPCWSQASALTGS